MPSSEFDNCGRTLSKESQSVSGFQSAVNRIRVSDSHPCSEIGNKNWPITDHEQEMQGLIRIWKDFFNLRLVAFSALFIISSCPGILFSRRGQELCSKQSQTQNVA